MPRDHRIQNSTKAVAAALLTGLDAAARVVDPNDEQAQYFLECIRDELAPQLKWAFRYGEWQLDAPPFITDDVPTDPGFEELDPEG